MWLDSQQLKLGSVRKIVARLQAEMLENQRVKSQRGVSIDISRPAWEILLVLYKLTRNKIHNPRIIVPRCIWFYGTCFFFIISSVFLPLAEFSFYPDNAHIYLSVQGLPYV